MGNKALRPNIEQPLSGFSDEQMSYLKNKFDFLCDESKLLSPEKIQQAFRCSRQEASKILNYIDFQNKGEVDFYQFTCAAASLHENDEDAKEFLYDLFGNGEQLTQQSFKSLFSAVVKYLKYYELHNEDYTPQMGTDKFKQYDYDGNGSLGFEEFKIILKNDFYCRKWMEALGFAEPNLLQPQEKPNNEQNQFQLEQAEGDQAGSTPSWVKTVNYMAPEDKIDTSYLDTPPTSKLQLEYVYGYRSYDTNDNLRYNSNGQIIYHTAACGIVLNKAKNTMKVNVDHNDDITSLDYNMNKNLVVTGQMGRTPSLIVWDSNSMETKHVFKSKKLQHSISHVSISKSGKYVAAASMSDKHQIVIYDLTKKSMMAFGNGPRSVIHAIKFTNNQEQLVCACQKQVVFIRFLDGKIENKRGVFGKAPLVANYSIALAGDAVVTGMGNGVIGYWKGNVCSRVYKQHLKPVTALGERKQGGIISGDTTGVIILWSANLSKQRQINLQKIMNSNNPKIISLCEGFGNILVGTRGGQIVQVQQKTNSATVVMQGHFDKQLWGLSVTPNRHQFITGGQDKLLIKWDTNKRKLITKKKLDFSISSIDISRNGMIAVGHTNGIIAFYDCNKLDYLKKIQTFKNPDKQMISVVKFSPNGSTIAVGYCPPISQVYFYNVQTGTKIAQSGAKSSRIYSIDFTRDGSAVMINNTSYQILFYNANNGSQITSASQFRRQQFATMTSRFSWHTQGIWPPCSDGTDINSVDRSNSKKYLVTADDWSKVKMFKYPVCQRRQIYNVYRGHSSHVTGIKWMYDDKYVISIGGLEKSIIQWVFQESQQIVYQYEEKKQQQQQKKIEEQEKYQEQLPEQSEIKKPQEGQFNLEQNQGDQAMAVKPFLGQVKSSIPESLRNKQIKNVPPQQQLLVKHVWGLRNQYINDRVRNQLKYSPSYTSCIFITAALGVDMNLKTKNQTFYQGHQQDLVSFAITKDRRYCATGQMAQLNKNSPKNKIMDIHVWDSETKQNRAVLKGFHMRAVVVLEFSPSGKRLLSVGQDDKNSLAVYDWEVGRKAWSSPVCGAKVTGAAWKNQQQYMTVGFKHIKYWNKQKGTMCKVPGKWDPMMSVVFWNNMFVSGGSTGVLYLWSGTTAITTKGHEGRVDCLQVDKNTLYSGCSKGIINKWKYSGGKIVLDQKVLNMAEFDKFSPGILSLDFSDENMLICTNSSSIYQIPQKSKQNPNIIMQSHYIDQLWAESWSPESNKFVTGGDDSTVRIYDAKTFQLLHCHKMAQKIRGVDWQKSNGDLIVVGDLKGRIYLFDKQLNLLDQSKTRFSKTKPRKQPFWIQAIKFSPNGKYVALGTHGGTTYISIFQITDNKFGKQITSKNLVSSAVLSIDWDKSSNYLAIISQAYQLQFTNLVNQVSASSMKSTEWASWTGKFGAYVQQIHMDVDYSNINSVDISPNWKLVATGNDSQKINLFQCPVILGRQKHKQFVGHSSHVTKVRFSANQQYLLSTGGNDRTIILWKVYQQGQQDNENQQKNQQKLQDEQKDDNQGNQDADQVSIPFEKAEKQTGKSKKKITEQQDEDQFGLQLAQGDQFMAVKPWQGAIKPPTSKFYKGTGKAPRVQLTRQYAHGYRSKDCRNNLIYVSQDKIAYHTAGLGVIMNISQLPRSQNFFDKHTDDIISMCWNSDKSAIFTGQMGAKPLIFQWSPKGDLIQSYVGALKGVSALGVNDKYLAAAGMDDNHYVYLFDIKSGKKIAEEKGGREFITGLKWVDGQNFVTIGVKHFKSWIVSGKSIKAKTGIFNKNCNILCCLEIKEDKIYAGASNGHLQVWSGNSCLKSIEIHKKASLNALKVTENIILTGSKDCTICILDQSNLQVLSRINCKQLFIDSVNSEIEALDVYENKIIVGTKGSQIFQIKSNQPINITDKNSQFKLCGHYMSGHYSPNYVTNQVWGLSLYKNNYYLSSGDDGTLRVWDINKRQQFACVNLDLDEKLLPRKRPLSQKFLPNSCKGNSIAVAKTGEIVVGTKDGKIIVFNQSFNPILVQKVCKSQLRPEISVVKLSPDEKTLAVGDHQGRIVLLKWNQGQSRMKIKSQSIKHSSAIKNLDFSRDSNIIHSTCTSYELLFWDVNTGQQIKSGATMTRDQQWATWSLSLGWPVKGIFEQFMDGSDINAVDRSKNSYGDQNMKLLATSDDRSHVRILEYPCLQKHPKYVMGTGHSSHVTNVLFSNDDKRIFSTGGQDATVIQWVLNTDQL